MVEVRQPGQVGNRVGHPGHAARGGGADTGFMRYLSTDTTPATTRISRIGLGTWQFGSREWGYGQSYAGQEAHAIVRRAVELGVTLFDTAEIYGFGRSERILGEAIGEDRESVFLATKILPLLPIAPVVEQRAVASANRLGTRRLDLYQVHQPNPVVRDGTIMRGMRALQRVGLVAEVGVSNYSLERWRAAEHALGSRVLSNQVSYSLVDRTPERDLVPFAESTGHVVIAYSPLAQGLLSGKYHRGSRPVNRIRAASPLFLPENLDPGRRPDRCPARGGGRAFRHARPDRPGLGSSTGPPSSPYRAHQVWSSFESNVAAASIDLSEDESTGPCTRRQPGSAPSPDRPCFPACSGHASASGIPARRRAALSERPPG